MNQTRFIIYVFCCAFVYATKYLEHSDWLVRNPAEYNDIQLKLPDTTFSY